MPKGLEGLGRSCPKSLQNDSWWFPWNKMETNSMISSQTHHTKNFHSFGLPMLEGRILEQGRHAELLALNGAYKRTGKPREVEVQNLWGCLRCLDSLRKDEGKLEMFQDVFLMLLLLLFLLLFLLLSSILSLLLSSLLFLCSDVFFSHQGWWKISDFLPNTRRAFEKKIGSSWGAWFWHLGTWGDIPKKGLLKLPLLLFKHNINNIYIYTYYFRCFFLIFFEHTFDYNLPLFGDFKRKHVGHILSKAGSSGIQIHLPTSSGIYSLDVKISEKHPPEVNVLRSCHWFRFFNLLFRRSEAKPWRFLLHARQQPGWFRGSLVSIATSSDHLDLLSKFGPGGISFYIHFTSFLCRLAGIFIKLHTLKSIFLFMKLGCHWRAARCAVTLLLHRQGLWFWLKIVSAKASEKIQKLRAIQWTSLLCQAPRNRDFQLIQAGCLGDLLMKNLPSYVGIIS